MMTLTHSLKIPSAEQIVRHLKALVGDSFVLTDPKDLETYGQDWTRLYIPRPTAIVKPKTTSEVAAIISYCASHQVALVPSGGRTGLAGGAVAPNGEVVLSLDRMNQIIAVDAVGLTISVEAGVTTQQVQEAAKEVGLFFPLDLAAKGTSQIGGNIATNAGGVKFIRFGGMREQVLGLEVVLPSGEILDMNSGIRKNNTGYDLKQLFIASEGTLGIITKATLKLAPPAKNAQVALMAVEKFDSIPKILARIHLTGALVTACEFFTKAAHEIVLKHSRGAKPPFNQLHPYYVLLELEEGAGADRSALNPMTSGASSIMETVLESLLNDELIVDATVAATPTQAKELWGLRENITESIAVHGHARKNDISLAVNDLSPFIEKLSVLLAEIPVGPLKTVAEKIELVLFGHIGDGNLHINYVTPKTEPFKEFQENARKIEEKVFALLPPFRGSISAEHGIGLTKKKDLHFSRTKQEVDLMRQLKKLFDPKNIMNPGKIFDL